MNADFHMHSDFSSDAEFAPEEMIRGAIARGLRTICFTDHQDKDYQGGSLSFTFDTELYFQTMERLREAYRNVIDVRIGVELGLQPHLGEYYEQYVGRYPFDFVLGSVHVIQSEDPYYPEFFEKRTDREAYEAAFLATLENIRAVSEFDVLGHLDYIVRYGKDRENYSYHAFSDLIDEILRELIWRGKGMELNMAGYKYGLGFGHPHPDILKRYRELGGEIITVGSDGHRPEHLAYEFRLVSGILKSCGFQYYTEFKERKPVFQQLP
ncbi:MAG: histidinol-phosphatase HisJ family protein [Lachnospiraceae bacterium]|nr:histidinol-phosphatase HisJ family protein [Lachnospiraceae bacterium]